MSILSSELVFLVMFHPISRMVGTSALLSSLATSSASLLPVVTLIKSCRSTRGQMRKIGLFYLSRKRKLMHPKQLPLVIVSFSDFANISPTFKIFLQTLKNRVTKEVFY